VRVRKVGKSFSHRLRHLSLHLRPLYPLHLRNLQLRRMVYGSS